MKRKPVKIYELSHSIDLSEVGEVPQSDNASPSLVKADLDHLTYIRRNQIIPDTFPHLQNVLLDPGARFTDWIDCTYLSQFKGMLVSTRMYELVTTLKLCPHKVYPATVCQNEENRAYYFILSFPLENEVLYLQSDFIVDDFINVDNKPTTPIQLDSSKMFKAKNRKLPIGRMIKAQHLLLNEVFDVFSLPFYTGLFISEKGKKALESAGMTGWTAEEGEIKFSILEGP